MEQIKQAPEIAETVSENFDECCDVTRWVCLRDHPSLSTGMVALHTASWNVYDDDVDDPVCILQLLTEETRLLTDGVPGISSLALSGLTAEVIVSAARRLQESASCVAIGSSTWSFCVNFVARVVAIILKGDPALGSLLRKDYDQVVEGLIIAVLSTPVEP